MTEQSMGELDHTNPYTDEAFGEACVFERGPVVAADGGQHRSEGDLARTDADADTDGSLADVSTLAGRPMREVSHTRSQGVRRAFERGAERP